MSDLPDNVVKHIKEEAQRINYGEISIIFNGNDKIDVITKHRNRFEKEEKQEQKKMIEEGSVRKD